MSEKKETTFINGIYIKEFVFSDGGSVLNVDISVDRFIEEIQKHKGESGYVKLRIGKNKKPTDKGNTHSVSLNTFTAKPMEETKQESEQEPTDDLPF